MYLAEVFGELKGQDAKEKAAVSKWVFFANASLSSKVIQGAGRTGSPGWRIAMTPLLRVLEDELSNSATGFLLGGDTLTAADIAVASLLLYTPVFHVGEYTLLKDFPKVVDYMERMSERPGYQRAYGQERLEIVQDGIAGYRNPTKAKMRKGGWSMF